MTTFDTQIKRNISSIHLILHASAVILLLWRITSWIGSPLTAATASLHPASTTASAHQIASTVLTSALKHSSDVRVYVYNLPPKYNTLQVAKSHQKPAPIRDPYCDLNFYSAEVTLHRALLKSNARTLDPNRADFFYVPIYVTCFLINNHPNNLTKTGMFFDEAMLHVTRKYPFFNASQGRDHVYTFTQGFGARLAGDNWRKWRNGIFLTHNGDFNSEEFVPRKDIVIPPDLSHYITPVYSNNTERRPQGLDQRLFLAHFGGQAFSSSIADHRGSNYSGGVRQFLANDMYRTLGFRITGTRSEDYLHDMTNSMFCLAPEGWHPWSPRPYYGLLLGCVPVVLSERQELAFEDEIPYDDLVIWIRPEHVFSINTVLRSIPAQDILKRLRIMERIWPLFWYHGEGRALDTILAELARHKYSSHPSHNYRPV
ncbi:putative glucuronosyltransferase [Gracilariopsis chorda]|uniref:Putative glucuronosyltransferase n=1 Tax=Gracilariopsis chorda TaxID=448386 RepID=A0A2V3ISV9_9FLOR|nr:putative glucuronosyltransferase [Gracilariopsis chorda]|eukprot:PXF45194.1 putative glucuronosyltransferase [Gracilariopsis chorda]